MNNSIQKPENFHQLAQEIAKMEGKKKQTDIAQISEILSVLGKIYYQFPGKIGEILYFTGKEKEAQP